MTRAFQQPLRYATLGRPMSERSHVFFSCDWGTTSFRLRLVENRKVLKEYSDSTGCRALYDGSSNHVARQEAFQNHLRKVLESWGTVSPSPLPLLISGMASSTIGWKELAYAPLPLRLTASNLRVEQMDWLAPSIVEKTFLVSGAASETEMMRGEETEAIGLFQLLPAPPHRATLILPGTHSKHLSVADGSITKIETFMTGELFELLSKQSVLRASIDPSAPLDDMAFKNGLDRVRAHGVPSSLFQTRTRQVLGKNSLASNASFLSGLLIGAELTTLRAAGDILIARPNSVRDLYALAAKHLGLTPTHVFSAEEVQLAVPTAHELILSRIVKSA